MNSESCSESARLMSLIFNDEISERELPLFRGAVINAMDNANVLFHNHVGDGYRYSYPLIQYKRIHNCAAIISIDDGADAIGQLLSACNFNFRLGSRATQMKIASVNAQRHQFQIWDTMFSYRIRRWLPFNSENYHRFQEIKGLADKITFLQGTLTANILSLAKGLGVHFDKQVLTTISEIVNSYEYTYKGIRMQAFDLEFSCNVSLPQYIGIGKNASLGAGTITKRTE
jgi:hypothetical protein